MTGRDYKKLIKFHRDLNTHLDPNANENLKYVSKLIDSAKPIAKYQPFDYSLFKNFIKERKVAADDSLSKVKHIEDTSKAKRELLYNKHQKLVWMKELSRLESQQKYVEAEMDDYYKLLAHNSVAYYDLNSKSSASNLRHNDYEDSNEYAKTFHSLNVIDALETYAKKLSRERDDIKLANDLLLKDLKDDLRFYMNDCKSNATSGKYTNESHEQVVDMIVSVKDQFAGLIADLDYEYKNISQDLIEYTKETNRTELRVTEGIPPQAHELDCPSEELKVSVLQEFLIIDYKYKDKLRQLNEVHKEFVAAENNNSNTIAKYGGWNEEDHDMFVHIYEQYHTHPVNLNNCNFSLRDLMFDKMKRVFQHVRGKRIERTEFVKHEEWSIASKYYYQQRRLILSEWAESRRALLLKAEATFAEAYEMIEAEKVKKEEKEKQLLICNELYEKVSRWRNQKLEALEIQQTIDRIIKQQNAERLRVENERRDKKRMEQKQALANYHQRMEMHKKQLERDEKNRLENLRKKLQEQAARDQEKIDLRNRQFLDKKIGLISNKLSKLNEMEEREKRLQKFYESVKPKVEADPARVTRFTEAEKRRRGLTTDGEEGADEVYEDRRPLFRTEGFTDKQLGADARLRVEERLRQAGLINNEYARVVINTLKQNSMAVSNKRDLNANSNWSGFAFKS